LPYSSASRKPEGSSSAPGLHVLTIVREVEAILQAKTAPLGYQLIEADLEDRIAALISRVMSCAG
jgi:hypothetical protein